LSTLSFLFFLILFFFLFLLSFHIDGYADSIRGNSTPFSSSSFFFSDPLLSFSFLFFFPKRRSPRNPCGCSSLFFSRLFFFFSSPFLPGAEDQARYGRIRDGRDDLDLFSLPFFFFSPPARPPFFFSFFPPISRRPSQESCWPFPPLPPLPFLLFLPSLLLWPRRFWASVICLEALSFPPFFLPLPFFFF